MHFLGIIFAPHVIICCSNTRSSSLDGFSRVSPGGQHGDLSGRTPPNLQGKWLVLCLPRLVRGRASKEIMAGLIEKRLDDLTLNASKKEQLRRQGDLVIKGFRALADEKPFKRLCPNHPSKCPHRTAEYPPHLTDSENSANRFHWSSPSQLGQQITKFSELLDPSLLRSQPGHTLKLILEIQSGIRESLDEIKDVLREIPLCPRVSSKTRVDDGHLHDFKDFRTIGLENEFKDLTRLIKKLFSTSEGHILDMRLPHEADELPYDEGEFPLNKDRLREVIIRRTSESSEATKRVIQWIEASEFDLVRQDWMSYTRRIDSAIVDVVGYMDDALDPELKLAEGMLAISKLSRVLLKKLSKQGTSSKEGIRLYTDLCSKQLTSLLKFGSQLHMSVREFADVISRLIPVFRYDYEARKLRGLLKPLETNFEHPLALISSHFVPILAADYDGSPVENDYREWLVTWSTQFGVAIRNFKDTIRAFGRHPPYVERSRLW
ncbi:hypothetical protein Pst134EB_014054 [Puccinia striiformis f. sp. tritici]|nr:hypothetical protein Pst134EB_014054 [Puccinia striiformis f. sp. tritici]